MSSSRRDNWELERRLQTACLLIITATLCAFAAYWMRAVLIPFVLAFFLFQLLEPMVRLLNRKARLPHPLAVTVTLIIVATVLVYTSSVVTGSVGGIIKSSDTYATRISTLMESVWDKHPALEERFKAIFYQQLDKFTEGVGSFIAALTNSVIYLISQSTVVMLFLMFLLFGSKSTEELSGVLADIDEKIKNYIQVKTSLSLITGFLVGLLLHLLGVELAFVFGLLAVLLNFIPNVGSIIATLLPIPVILVSPEIGTVEAALAIILPGTIQFLVGNLLEPKLLGDSLNLSPVIILFSLTVWTALWGGIGALLAVPITSIIQILCEQMAFTRPVAAVLRGDIIALINAYKKPDTAPPKAKDKSIPKGLKAASIDDMYDDIKGVQKKL
jgi:AI-2 transport protein TqsA